jgi:hypothetical protein
MVRRACKRCNQIPSWDDGFTRGFGARSRTDNKTRICNECGIQESLEDFLEGGPTPQRDWPINRDY